MNHSPHPLRTSPPSPWLSSCCFSLCYPHSPPPVPIITSLLSDTGWSAPITLFCQPTQASVCLVHVCASPDLHPPAPSLTGEVETVVKWARTAPNSSLPSLLPRGPLLGSNHKTRLLGRWHPHAGPLRSPHSSSHQHCLYILCTPSPPSPIKRGNSCANTKRKSPKFTSETRSEGRGRKRAMN